MTFFNRQFLAVLTAILFVGACAPLSTDNDPTPFSSHPGMVKVAASGKSFQQGWNSALASPDEKPGMPSSFTYDYWIDSTEVTQKMFYDCTGRRPVADTSHYGVGNNYPVYHVTWFDAVVFCNARSKAENLDTCYLFSKKDTLQNGSMYDLTGLRCNFSKDGYRLPTEAEWEFAARGGAFSLPFSNFADSASARNSAWFSGNAGDASNPVAKKAANAFGLFDMAGNVFEWVNDWKTFYSGDPVSNSLGAEWPDAQFQRVIKGGSFKHGFLFLRPSARSATYATTVSSSAEYVGFRCARGAIPGNSYISSDTSKIQTNPVDLLTSDVQQFLGTAKARVVFVNAQSDVRTLCFVDFGSSHPMVKEFRDFRSVYCPVISPDGRYVAFATRNEGLSGPSSVYVRPLDSLEAPPVKIPGDSCFIPRWWIDRAAGDTCLIYTNSAVDNTSSSWNTTATFRQKMAGGRAVGAREAVTSDGGFHDGLSWNGRYLASGYRKLLMRDRENNLTRQLFTTPLNGKDGAGSDQVCNVSISPDNVYGNRCMFLDFGYPRSSSLVGSGYGIHEYLFIADFEGSVLAWFRTPAGTSAWGDAEWSNTYAFGIAGANENGDEIPGIYLVNLTDGSSSRILHGTDLRQPGLWVGEIAENPSNLSADSLGNYDDPSLSGYQQQLSYKMHVFWEVHDSVEAVFTGSSQTFNGIDCSKITGLLAINMGYGGGGLSGSVTLIREYVLNHCPKIRVVGLSATPYWLAEPGGNAFDLNTAGITWNKGYLYDKNHGFWKSGLPQGFDAMMAKAPYFNCCEWGPLGWGTSQCVNWGGPNPSCSGRMDWNVDNAVYRQNFEMLRQLVIDLASLKIHVIMINFPENPAYKNTDHFGSSGPSWETGKAVMAQFKSLETGTPYYHFYDAYNNGDHDYTDADAMNQNHLCAAGAAKLTVRIDSLIHTFLN